LGAEADMAGNLPVAERWQFEIRSVNERIGNVRMTQDDLAVALKSYDARRNIVSRLAKADPNNAERQRDLALSMVG